LAGGVGGAKLVHGLAKLLNPEDLSIIVNTGDDFEYLSLNISPDLDTVCYTLAGMANPETGWGLKDETWTTYQSLGNLGAANWFHLGDRDIATHLLRTTWLDDGRSLSEITTDFCGKWGVDHQVFPMSNDPIRTIVHTKNGEKLGFQEYFVHLGCQPEVKEFKFLGAEKAKPLPEAIQALMTCDLVIIAPSNPWVSIGPILAVPSYREILFEKLVIAVSPIIGGKALKGPAAKMYRELGFQPSAEAVCKQYGEILDGFVFDTIDLAELEKIQRCRIIPLVTDIIMKNEPDRVRLAEEILQFGESILNRSR
jgi:LPPG:FO 2-phospho-L-lactate transferase